MTPLRTLVSALCLAVIAAPGALAADSLRIVDEAAVSKDWAPAAALPAAGYPAAAKDPSNDVCINLGYQIDKDGKVAMTSLGVLKVWSSEKNNISPSAPSLDPYVQAAAAALSQRAYVPTPEAPSNRVVYTSAAFAFVGSKGTPVADVRARCTVDDLRSFIANEQKKAGRRGDVKRTDGERYNRENTAGDQAIRAAAARVGG